MYIGAGSIRRSNAPYCRVELVRFKIDPLNNVVNIEIIAMVVNNGGNADCN